MLPRITIITPCLNGARYVAEALTSVSDEYYPDLEHVVIDGESTDGTLDTLKSFPEVSVVSEPDENSHDAINKGIARATGEVIGILNTDDQYAAGVLHDVGQAFADDPALDTVAGRTIVFEEESGRIIVARNHDIDDGFWLPELLFGAPGFCGRFYRRRVFARVGLLDVSHYHFGADRHFLLRLALMRPKAFTLPRTSLLIRSHEGSATFNPAQRNAAAFALENLEMARAFCTAPNVDSTERETFVAWHAFENLRLLIRGPRGIGVGATLQGLAAAARYDPFWLRHLPRALAFRAAVRRLANVPAPLAAEAALS